MRIKNLRMRIRRFFHLISREYLSHNLPGMASSLSYTTLLALVPVFAIILGVLGFLREGFIHRNVH